MSKNSMPFDFFPECISLSVLIHSLQREMYFTFFIRWYGYYIIHGGRTH